MGKRKIEKYNEKVKAKEEEVEAKEYELAKITKDVLNLSDDEIEKLNELTIEYDAVNAELDKLNAELDKLKDNLEELENNPPKDRQIGGYYMGKRKIEKYNKKVEAKEYKLARISEAIANLSDDEIEKLYELKIEYEAVSAKLDKLRAKPPRDREYEKIDKKDNKIDDLHRILSELEYQREDCLQHLNQLKMEEQELMQALENAKIIKDVNAITGAREKLLKVRAEISKVDKRLNKIIASITMKSIRKAKLQETVIAEYKKYARRTGETEIEMNIKISRAKSDYKDQDETRRERQQKKYRKDNFLKEDSEKDPTPPKKEDPKKDPTPPKKEDSKKDPTPSKKEDPKKDPTPPKKEDSKKDPTPPKKEDPKKDPTPPKKEDSKKDQNPMPRELDDERREELEKESIERYEAKQSSKKHVRLRRFIGRIWKKITSILALGSNKLGRLANKGLLAAGDSLQNKLKNDEDIYEKRVDKFRQGYRSTLSQEKQEEIARKELEKVNSNKQNQEHKNSNEDQQQE